MRLSHLCMVFVTGLAVGATKSAPATAQDTQQVVGHVASVSADASSLQLDLANGQRITLQLSGGEIRLDGERIGTYELRAELERSWRDLLGSAGRLSSEELFAAITAWRSEALTGSESGEAIASRLDPLTVARSAVPVPEVPVAPTPPNPTPILRLDGQDVANRRGLADQIDALRDQFENMGEFGLQLENERVHVGDITVPRGETIDDDLIVLSGDVSVFGHVTGNVVALDGDVIVHSSGAIDGDVASINGRVTRAGGRIGGNVRSEMTPTRVTRARERPQRGFTAFRNGTNLASVLGMFVALPAIGFGLTFFLPRQLDVVSTTVSQSFGKSFLAGLFAQPLILPAFAMLIAGLAITIVGILVIPFAIVAGVLAVIAMAVGGYLAVAKATGDTYTVRRMAQGRTITSTPARNIVYGLIGLLAIWLPAALLGWIPFLGQAFALLAALFTWVMLTAGFGATILSRAGLRATFGSVDRRAALTDEHYWPSDTGGHRAQLPTRTRKKR